MGMKEGEMERERCHLRAGNREGARDLCDCFVRGSEEWRLGTELKFPLKVQNILPEKGDL